MPKFAPFSDLCFSSCRPKGRISNFLSRIHGLTVPSRLYFWWFLLILNDSHCFFCVFYCLVVILEGNHGSEAKIMQNPMQKLWFGDPFATFFLRFFVDFQLFFCVFQAESQMRAPMAPKSYGCLPCGSPSKQ